MTSTGVWSCMAAARGTQPCRRAAAGRLLQMSLPWMKRYGWGSSQCLKSPTHPHSECLPCARSYSICAKPHLCPCLSSCPFRLSPISSLQMLEQSALLHLMLEVVQLA